MNNHFDVLGIGSAIVDVLSFCDEAFLARQELVKGSMTLIDEARAESLYRALGPATECSGGSAANTLAGLASLGAHTAFIGKVCDDQLGSIFRHDMQALGVHFATEAASNGPASGRCFVFVTPDGERTMATYLGACTGLSEHDMDAALIANAEMLYIEGYQWDQPDAKRGIRAAIAVAKQAGKKVALTLSDTFCVERHRAEFLTLTENDVDVLFANEGELLSLYKTEDLDTAMARVRDAVEIAAVTRSEKGCIVLTENERLAVPGEKIARVTDTTGAGDLFASGFLFGLARGWDIASAAALGNKCAAAIIQQLGARSLQPLGRLVA